MVTHFIVRLSADNFNSVPLLSSRLLSEIFFDCEENKIEQISYIGDPLPNILTLFTLVHFLLSGTDMNVDMPRMDSKESGTVERPTSTSTNALPLLPISTP